jgi:hypothetical protein
MINLKQWMEVVDYRITEGDQYYSEVFGNDARCYCLSAWNGDHDGYTFNIIFDTDTQVVYMVEACDYKHNRAYRRINPNFVDAYNKNANEMDHVAWDDVKYIDLDVDDDWMDKALAIKSGEDYDTRVSIPLDFTDEELLKYMKMAHEKDMTFNKFVEEALKAAIDHYEKDPEGALARAKEWKESQLIKSEDC